jgi:putative ABC transport system permease protein
MYMQEYVDSWVTMSDAHGPQVRSLGAIGRRLLTDRRARVVLTTAGVVLGVALFTGCLLTTTTATQGFEAFARETAGDADVVATAPGGAMQTNTTPRGGEQGERVVAALAALPGVDRVGPLLGVPTVFEGADGRRTEQRVNFSVAAALIGLELRPEETLYPVVLADGRLPADGADELVLSEKVAASLGVAVGAPVQMSTAQGEVPLAVVGILDAVGIGNLDDVAFSSLATARRLHGQPEAITQVALALEAGIEPAAWIEENAGRAPEGTVLTDASEALRTFREQIGALSGAMTVLGGGLLLIAAFLIYLTLSMSVAERTRLYGTLRALGASRAQVRRVVYAEALFIGGVGTALGLLLGVLVAAGLRAATDRLLSLFGGPELVLTPWVFVVAAAVGLTMSLVSAMVPARRAARTDPAAAVRATHADPALPPVRRTFAAVMAVAGIIVITRPGLTAVLVGMLLFGAGLVRLVPFLIQPIARALAPLVTRASRVGGRVAVQHLTAERTRSAYTLSLVMLVMTLAVVILSLHSSFTSSLDRQLRATIGEALTVEAAASFDDGFVTALAEVEGVAAVTAGRSATSSYVDRAGATVDVFVAAIDPATYFDVGGLLFTDGDRATTADALATQDAVVLPAPTADRLDLGRGDQLTLETLAGPRPFEVAAVAELSNLPAELIVGVRSAELFGAREIEEILVLPEVGVDPEALRHRIEAELSDTATFLVATAAEHRADTRSQIGGGINSFFLLLGLAAIVGTFGLANTMVVSVTARYREIGVLRAIGARRRHVRGIAITEALLLVAVALVLALPAGLLVSHPMLEMTRNQLSDLTVHYRMPWSVVPVMALIGAAVAVGASAWPAGRASRIEIDDALRFE